MTVWSIAQPNKIEEDEEKKLLNRWTNALDNVQKAQEKFKLFGNLWWIDKAYLAIITIISVICLAIPSISRENIVISLNWAVIPVGVHLIICLALAMKSSVSNEIRDYSKYLRIDGKLSNENFNMIKTRREDLANSYSLTEFKIMFNAIFSMLLVVPLVLLLKPHSINKRDLGPFLEKTVQAGFGTLLAAFLSIIGYMLLGISTNEPTLGKMRKLIELEDDNQAEPFSKNGEDAEKTLVARWKKALDNVQKTKDGFKLYGNLWWIDKVFLAVVTGIVVICLINRSLITPNLIIFMNSMYILGISIQVLLNCLTMAKTWNSEEIPKNLKSLQIDGKLSNESFIMIKTRLENLEKSINSTFLKIGANFFIFLIIMIAVVSLDHYFLVSLKLSRNSESFRIEVFLLSLFVSAVSMIVNLVSVFSFTSYPTRLGKMKKYIDLEDNERQMTLWSMESNENKTLTMHC